MKRRAFTLVELLVTAVLFSVVAGYAVVIFSVSSGAGLQAQRSSSVTGGVRRVLDDINHSFDRSSMASPPSAIEIPIAQSTSTSCDSLQSCPQSALVFTTELADQNGYFCSSAHPCPGSAVEQRVYCPVLVNGHQRLALFTFATPVALPSTTPSSTQCNAASLQATLGAAQPPTGPIYLTDDSTDVLSFKTTPIQYGVAGLADVTAFHVVLTAVYDSTVSSSASDRADTTAKTPITVEMTTDRTSVYGEIPFNGI